MMVSETRNTTKKNILELHENSLRLINLLESQSNARRSIPG